MTTVKTLPALDFFSGLVNDVFEVQFGVPEPTILDYLSGLLTRFIHIEKLYPVRSLSGMRLIQIADLLAEAQLRLGTAARQIYRHIGDFALFYCGIYPEYLKRLPPWSRDRMVSYPAEGKRSYFLASRIETDDDNQPPGEVLDALSQRFDFFAYGLREVRRTWEGDPSSHRLYLFN